jgi:hypothetical protein
MAITQLSRIQLRRGKKEDLPQLSSGEMGWAIDTQQLYIGNGTLSEGAPEVGNTLILTEDTDLISAFEQYTYQGNNSLTITTGVDANTPVKRTLQDRLDDNVSVKAFGAVGDGTTNDRVAIQRALTQLYTQSTDPATRVTLHFPAGKYVISGGTLKIPPYANLSGAGHSATIIEQQDSGQDCVAETVDNLLQTRTSIGTGSGIQPQEIHIHGITFKTTQSTDVFKLWSCKNSHFDHCGFEGTYTNGGSLGAAYAGVNVRMNSATPTQDVFFTECEFIKNNVHVKTDDDVVDVNFHGTRFEQAFHALYLGVNSSGTGAQTTGPKAFKCENCFFDQIDQIAFLVGSGSSGTLNVRGHTSVNNTYLDVGNDNQGYTNPSQPIIQFSTGGNSSTGDYFERRIRTSSSEPQVAEIDGVCRIIEPALGTFTLTDNTAAATLVSPQLRFDANNDKSVRIFYKLDRGNQTRSGYMIVAFDSNNANLNDEFTDNNGDIGVTFSTQLVDKDGDTVNDTLEIRYTTTSTGTDVSMDASVEILV